MYSRKEFLVMAVKQCSDFVNKVNSNVALTKEESINGSEEIDPDSMFLEAMRLGIDPGTMDMNQLSRTLTLAKEQIAEKGGGDPSEKRS